MFSWRNKKNIYWIPSLILTYDQCTQQPRESLHMHTDWLVFAVHLKKSLIVGCPQYTLHRLIILHTCDNWSKSMMDMLQSYKVHFGMLELTWILMCILCWSSLDEFSYVFWHEAHLWILYWSSLEEFSCAFCIGAHLINRTCILATQFLEQRGGKEFAPLWELLRSIFHKWWFFYFFFGSQIIFHHITLTHVCKMFNSVIELDKLVILFVLFFF